MSNAAVLTESILSGGMESAAIIVKCVLGITKQRSTATSCHEVDRQAWLDEH